MKHQTESSRLWTQCVGAILLLFALFTGTSAAASLQAHVDRNPVTEGETFNLIIEAKGSDGGARPNLSPLENDFDVLGTSQSNRINMINGQISRQQQWLITLSPKGTGNLTIPSIQVGDEQTKPLSLEVRTQNQATSKDQPKDIFVEATVNNPSPYVQQQVIYTVRIFHRRPIHEGSLTQPEPNDALVERLDQDTNYQTTRNGIQYRVVERRFAIAAQHSGRVTIPPTVLDAKVADDRSRNRSFSGAFNNLLPATRRIRLRSPELTLDVKPAPAQAPDDPWLPAKKVTLSEHWTPEPPTFRVGEPVTRTITLQAEGLTASQLPEIALSDSTAFNVYPDKSGTHNSATAEGVTGTRQQKLAVVPQQAGTVTLPEITIPWWDTEQDRQRVARLPARTITILPAQTTNQTPAHTAPPVERDSDSKRADQTEPLPTPSSTAAPTHPWVPTGYWPWLSAGLLLAWLSTLGLWWRERHRRSRKGEDHPSNGPQSLGRARRAVRQACQRNDAQGTKQALLDWAAARWPDHPPRSLGAIATRLNDEGAKAAINHLDQALYAFGDSPWQGDTAWRALATPLAAETERHTETAQSPLPPLYPSATTQRGART